MPQVWEPGLAFLLPLRAITFQKGGVSKAKFP